MQGKDVSEQEAQGKSSVGIDVCEAWLDVHILPAGESFRVANTGPGHRRLKRRLAPHDVALIAVEATGKWHRQLHRSLHAAGHPVAVVNPLRARLFAEAIGVLAKTDRLDARMLALFAASLTPTARPPAAKLIEVLKELVQARVSAVDEQTALRNQLASAETGFLRRQLKRRITGLASDIAALDREIERHINKDQGLARRYAILLSIPSFGPVVAATLLAGLAELGSLTDKQTAMLVGLAPLANDSGRRQGERTIRSGRPGVRRVLYLAALTASRCNQQMRAVYQRLVAAGKPPKIAIVAVARKLVVLANALLCQDRLWLPEAPDHA